MTWKELITQMLQTHDMEGVAYVTTYERDAKGLVVNRTHMPIARFSPFEASNTGSIIIEDHRK